MQLFILIQGSYSVPKPHTHTHTHTRVYTYQDGDNVWRSL